MVCSANVLSSVVGMGSRHSCAEKFRRTCKARSPMLRTSSVLSVSVKPPASSLGTLSTRWFGAVNPLRLSACGAPPPTPATSQRLTWRVKCWRLRVWHHRGITASVLLRSRIVRFGAAATSMPNGNVSSIFSVSESVGWRVRVSEWCKSFHLSTHRFDRRHLQPRHVQRRGSTSVGALDVSFCHLCRIILLSAATLTVSWTCSLCLASCSATRSSQLNL